MTTTAFDSFVTDLSAAIDRGDAPAVWAEEGMVVEINGATGTQWPQPDATVAISGSNDTGRTLPGSSISDWTDIWDTVERLAALPTHEERTLTELRRSQSRMSRLQMQANYARIERDGRIVSAAAEGISAYRIAKTLGIAESTVSRVLSREE